MTGIVLHIKLGEYLQSLKLIESREQVLAAQDLAKEFDKLLLLFLAHDRHFAEWELRLQLLYNLAIAHVVASFAVGIALVVLQETA